LKKKMARQKIFLFFENLFLKNGTTENLSPTHEEIYPISIKQGHS